MAKRKVIGAVYKAQKGEDGKPKGSNYIQIDKRLKTPVTFNPGDYIRVESKQYQLDSLAAAEAAGKLKGDMLADRKAQAQSIPDFVLSHLVVYED